MAYNLSISIAEKVYLNLNNLDSRQLQDNGKSLWKYLNYINLHYLY